MYSSPCRFRFERTPIDSMRNIFPRDGTINYSAPLSVIGIHCRLENFNYCPQNLQLAPRLWPRTVDSAVRKWDAPICNDYAALAVNTPLCIHGVLPKHTTDKTVKIVSLRANCNGMKVPQKIARIIVWNFYRNLAFFISFTYERRVQFGWADDAAWRYVTRRFRFA